jgi:hypothetical protein
LGVREQTSGVVLVEAQQHVAVFELGVRKPTTAGPLVAPVRVRQPDRKFIPYATYVVRKPALRSVNGACVCRETRS